MRCFGLLIAVAAAIGSLMPATAADQKVFPAYDTAQTCRIQADYAFAATLGDADRDKEFAACLEKEADRKIQAQASWTSTSLAVRDDCLNLASGRYAYLATCLDNARPRAAR